MQDPSYRLSCKILLIEQSLVLVNVSTLSGLPHAGSWELRGVCRGSFDRVGLKEAAGVADAVRGYGI